MGKVLQQELEILLDETEQSDVRDFTFELINTVFSEFCDIEIEDIDIELMSAYVQEVEQSLEIYNPALELDIIYIERLMKILDNYIKTHE